MSLEGDWTSAVDRPAGYGPIDAAHPPVARTPGYTPSTANVDAVGAGATQTVTLRNMAPANGQMPAYFRVPQLTVTPAAGPPVVAACTGKTATTFIGCTPAAPGVVAPATITATVEGISVTAPLQSWAGGVITVGGLNPSTRDFSPTTFWVLSGTNNVHVICEGVTHPAAGTHSFTRCNVPVAVAVQSVLTAGSLTAPMSTLGGFIKIELQDTTRTWRDVTMEILNWGFAGPNLSGRQCADPTPNAIVRLQRWQDNLEPTGNSCSYEDVPRATYFVPNVLFDTREAIYRDTLPAGGQPKLGGVMHYVALDVANLSRWLQNAAPYGPGSGNQALTDGESGGFSVYFSDRRNNRDLTNKETGEYGFEDVVNPTSATATPNNVLNAGEDMNASKTLETYGQYPSFNGTANSEPTGATGQLDIAAARPWSDIRAPYAQVNRSVLFRRALKLINGARGNIVAPGLTVAAENPIYIQGDWNATTQANGSDPFLEPNVATSVAGDAVTLLSTDWNDSRSFSSPYDTTGRPRADTSYRVAIISGKGPLFPQPAGTGSTFGTDGGVHSFLRFLEGEKRSVNYRGSMATLYYHRQALSPFKCCGPATGGVVYDTPLRRYEFDLDFLDPALLPPLTPMFRDLNALGFTQETRPGK